MSLQVDGEGCGGGVGGISDFSDSSQAKFPHPLFYLAWAWTLDLPSGLLILCVQIQNLLASDLSPTLSLWPLLVRM